MGGRPKKMDPDLPKGQQYRSIFPDRGLEQNCVPKSRVSCLKTIKQEAEVARAEEELKAKVEKAKWRSVEQGCDYDQYRQLCLGADLKCLPVGAIESVTKQELAPINRRTRRRGAKGATPAEPVKQELPTEPPKTRDEFEREWRRLGQDMMARYHYLCLIPMGMVSKLFKKGVEEHLGIILMTLQQGWGAAVEDNKRGSGSVARWLLALPQAFRFDLAVGFLGESEKAAGKALFDRLLAIEEEELVDDGESWTHSELTAA